MIQEKTVGSASYPSKRIVQVENIGESELYKRIILLEELSHKFEKLE